MFFTSYRRLVALASSIVLFVPFLLVQAQVVNNGASEATVAPGTQNVLVLDVTFPQIAPDTLTVPAGGLALAAGDAVYDVKSVHKLRTDNLTTPTKVWIDRDGSGRYTGAHAAGSKVQQGQGDFDLTLRPAGGLAGYSLSGSRATGGQYYRDVGAVPGYIDAGDQQVSVGQTTIQEQTFFAAPILRLYKLKTAGQTTCPSGLAYRDRIRVQSSANQNLFEITAISTMLAANGSSCTMYLNTNAPSPYPYRYGENMLRTNVAPDLTLEVVDNVTGGGPSKTTTKLRVQQGTLKGYAVGDIIFIEDVNQVPLMVEITGVSTISNPKTLDVRWVQEDNVLTLPPYRVFQNNQTASMTGTLTGLLNATTSIKHVDSDGDAAFDAGEPLYEDADANNKVSAGDEHITALIAEAALLGAPQDGVSGVLIDTTQQAAGQKWRRQSYTSIDEQGGVIAPDSKAYDVGDALIIDRNNDRFYQRDTLVGIAVDNTGTAVGSIDVERVELYLESNNQAGFQTNDTLLGAGALRAGMTKRWDFFPNRILTGSPRFYVVADIKATATNGTTMTFGLPFAAAFYSSGVTQPPQALTNAATQTITAAAPPPPPQDVTAPQLSSVDPPVIAARSVRYRFTTNEPARSSITCTDPGASSVSVVNNSLLQDVTIQVDPLLSNTQYTCGIRLTDASGNNATYPQNVFTTLQEQAQLAIVPGTIQVTPTHDTASVQWQTNMNASSMVDYVLQQDAGAAPAQHTVVNDATLVMQHAITLSGLQPLTTYEFTIGSQAGGETVTSNLLSFTTLAAPPPAGQQQEQQISVARSSVTVDLERVPADGTSVVTIVVMLRDADGSVVQNRTVSLRKVRAVVAGIGDVIAANVSDGLGRAVFQQASASADTYVYSAYVGDQLIGSSQVTFTVAGAAPPPAPPSPPAQGEQPATPPEVIATFTQCTPLAPAACDESLARRLFGRIVLAVERSGEAFYRYPKDLKAYYLGRPAQAFSIMRFLGAGISNRDIARLFANFSMPNPGDRAVFDTKDKALAVRFAGQIVLQVEAHGEAYYVHPITLIGYYLGRPDDAFRIMREQGLGISNRDLAKLELVSAPEGR